MSEAIDYDRDSLEQVLAEDWLPEV